MLAELLEASDLQEEMLSMKCHLCENFCSVAPIHTISEDGTKIKCGRCEDILPPFRVRNVMMEDLAKYFSFPCRYKDCGEIIPWGAKMTVHERECPNKTMKCPLFYACKVTILTRNLVQHMLHYHKENIHNDRVSVLMHREEYSIHLVLSQDQQFIVMLRKYPSPVIYVASVDRYGSNRKYDVELCSTKNKSKCIMMKDQKINFFDERDHCFECLAGKCELIYHPRSSAYGRISVSFESTVLDQNCIRPFLGDISELLFTVKICENGNKRFNNSITPMGIRPNNSISEEQSSGHLKKLLICSRCNVYMTGNTFSCDKGHAVCSNCKLHFIYCPVCLTQFGEFRYFHFANFASKELPFAQYFELLDIY